MQTVTLFLNPKDPESANSINRIAIVGRKVQVQPRADWDTNIGHCGKLCRCEQHCKNQLFAVNANTGGVTF